MGRKSLSPKASADVGQPPRSKTAALTEWAKAVEQNPADEAAWDEADEVARQTDEPDAVAALYRQVLEQALPAEIANQVGRRAVAFHDEWFEDTAPLLALLERILSIDHSASWAFERLSLLLTMAERWDELLAQYDRALLAAIDPEWRSKLLDEAARIAKDFAGDAGRANGYLKQLLLLRPEDKQLATSLERRLEQQGRHLDLIEVWQARLPVLNEEQALETRVRIAQRLLDPLGEIAAALERGEALLGLPQGKAAGIAVLERIATLVTAQKALRHKALSLLKEHYAETSRAADAIRVIELLLTIAAPDERATLHQQAAEWLIQTQKLDQALEHTALLLCLTPTVSAVREQLRSLSEKTGRHARAAAALMEAAEACSDVALHASLSLEAAQIYEDISDNLKAIPIFRSVLATQGAPADARLLAAQRLSDLLDGDDQVSERLEVLSQRADLEDDATRREVLGLAADLADTLGQTDRALQLLERRLTNVHDAVALDKRIAILERTERWKDLVLDLQRRAEHTAEQTQRRQDLARIALIWEQQLEEPRQAIQTWQEMEKLWGPSHATENALCRLYAVTENIGDWVQLLERIVGSTKSRERKIQHLGMLGDVLRERLADAAGAIERYRQGLQEDPEDAACRAGLQALLLDPAQASDAAETLAEAYRIAQDYRDLLALVELRLQGKPETTQREILLEAAELSETRASNDQQALGYLCRAFALNPEPAIERRLSALAKRTEGWPLLVQAYSAALHNAEGPERKRTLWWAQGHVLEEHLADFEGAQSAFVKMVELSPSEIDGALALVRVAAKLGDSRRIAWTLVLNTIASGTLQPELVQASSTAASLDDGWLELTVAMASELAARTEIDARIAHDLKRLLAGWYQEQCGDLQAAEATLREAVQAHPAADTLRLLADLQRQHPSQRLVETLLLLASATDDDLEALQEAATVSLTTAQDPQATEPILQRTLAAASQALLDKPQGLGAKQRVMSTAAWSLERLIELALQQAQPERALQLLEQGFALPFDRERRVALRFQAGQIAWSELHNDERAIELCRQVLKDDATHSGALELLGKLYESKGRYVELMDLHEGELGHSPPLERRLTLRIEQSRIASLLGGPASEQLTFLEQNLDESPGHPASIDRLAALLEAHGEFSKLHTVLNTQARAVAERGDRTYAGALWLRAGQCAERLADIPAALAAYRQSIDASANTEVLDRVAQLYIEQGTPKDAARWLEQRLQLTPAERTGERRDTTLLLAKTLITVGEQSTAERHLAAQLSQDPTAQELRDLLADRYRRSKNWALLAPLYTGGAQHAGDTASKVRYLKAAAEIYRSQVRSLSEAIPLLEQAASLDADDRALRLHLADALREAGRYDAARQLLSALLEDFGRRRTPERAAVHYALAKTAQAEGELSVALEQLESASSIQQGDPAILKLLGDVAHEKGELERSERAYRTLLLLIGRGVNAAATLVNEADAEAIGESAVLFELHRIAEEMGQAERAKDLLDSALEAAAADPAESKRLELALRDAGKIDLLLHALEQRLRTTVDSDTQALVLSEKADLLVALNRGEEALDCLLLAVSKAPDSAQFLAEARSLADTLGKTDQLYTTLQKLAEEHFTSDPSLSSSLWFVLGNIAEHDQQGPAKAAECYRRALQTGANPLQAFQALDRIAAELADVKLQHEALLSFAKSDQSSAHPSELSLAHQRLAEIDLDLGNIAGVADHLKQALDLGLAPDAVVGLARRGLDAESPNETLLLTLEQAARASGDQQSLLLALQLEAKRSQIDVGRLHEALQLAASVKDPSQAQLLPALIKAAREQKLLGSVIPEVMRYSEHLLGISRAREAAVLLDEAATQTQVQAEHIELQLKRAQIVQKTLNNPEPATRILEKLHDRVPEEPRVLRALAEIYREQGTLDKLESLLTKAERSAGTSEERNAIRLERARLLVLGKKNEEAEQSLLALVEEGAVLPQAMDLLGELYQGQGRTEELRELLARQLELAKEQGDAARVATSGLRLAHFQAVFDPGSAIDTLQGCLEWAPDNAQIFKALLEYYDPNDDSEERADAMEMLLRLDTAANAPALVETLIALQKRRGDEEGVRRALEIGCTKLPDDDALRERSFEWYRERGEFRALAEAMATRAARLHDPQLATAQYLAAANLYAEQCSDPEAAAQLLDGAVKQAPLNVALLSQLTEYLDAVGQTGNAMVHVERALATTGIAAEDAAALLHLRAALRIKLRPDDMAALTLSIADLDRAAEGDAPVLDDLATLLDKQRTLATQLGQQDIERSTTLRLARILPQIDQAPAGVNLLVAWIRDYPTDATAVNELGQLAAEAGKWGAAVKAFTRLVEITTGSERTEAALRLANACQEFGIPLDAKSVLEQVYRESGGDPRIGERLCAVLESAGAYHELAQFRLARLEQVTDNDAKFAQLREIGMLLMQAKAGASDAAAVFARALELKPTDHATTVNLAEAYVFADRISDAEALLDSAIAAHGKKRSTQLSELQHVMAHVARASGNDEAYLSWLDTALQTDRQNGKAASELALEAMNRGLHELAVKALQLVTLLRDSAPMSRAEAYLRQGMIANDKGDPKKAALLAKRALATDADYADAKAFLTKLGE